MRGSGFWGTMLLTLAIAFANSTALAGGHGCLFGTPCAQKCTCSSCCGNCRVYVHVCKVPATTQAPVKESARIRPESARTQMTYAPVLQSVPYVAAPMMPIQPVVYAAQQPRARTESGGTGGCNECARIDRLEEGVEKLGERMELIEMVLEEHSNILKKLAEKHVPNN